MNTLNKNTEYCKKLRKQTKLKSIEYLGGRCEICGYNKCPEALDFHHKDPTTKEFGLGSFKIKNWEKIKKELDKCQLLCANCHRELHHKIETSLEEYEKYINPRQIKEKTTIEKELDKNKIQIFHSNQLKQRKVKRPETYEQFKKEMNELNWNYCAMGRKYGVSDNAIRKWEKTYQKYGI